MEWKSIEKDGYPKVGCICLVTNNIGWMSNVQATFHPECNTFVLYDPNYRQCLTLDITHYIIIPKYPEE
jgi:hypothetical protein